MRLIDFDRVTDLLTSLYENPSAKRRVDMLGGVTYNWDLRALLDAINTCEADIGKVLPLKKMSESVITADGEPYLVTHHFSDYDKGWNDAIDKVKEILR